MRFTVSNIRRYDLVFLLLSASLVTYYASTAGGGFALDDSWIHQTYARNLAATGQWAFVPGVPSAASTSPLYTVLLAIGYKLGVNYLLWTHALGALALALTGMVGARLTERVSPGSRAISWTAGLALILAWHHIWAAASGMETMLFGAMTLVLICAAWRELDDNTAVNRRNVLLRGIALGVLAALTALTRPEGLVLAGLVWLSILVVPPSGSVSRLMLWTLGATIGFIVCISPYLLFNLRLTGGLLPDTAAAKQAEYALLLLEPYPARFARMVLPLIGGGQLLLTPGIIVYTATIMRCLRHERRKLLHLLPVLWALALIALYAARLPANYQHGRYMIPALPALILIGVIGLGWFMHHTKASFVGRVVSRTLFTSSALTFLFFAFGDGLSKYRQDVHIINEEMVASARWIADNIPIEELLAVHDIGAVGYFASRPILDLAGLVSPEVVPFFNDEAGLWALMQYRGARYLMAFPDQIPGKNPNDSRLCPLFHSGGTASPSVGGPNMVVYLLSWSEPCPS